MLTVSLILLAPVVLYLLSLPLSVRLPAVLRTVYRLAGAGLVFPAAAAAVYFAGYSGEQGGVPAYFVQLAALISLILLMAAIGLAHWVKRRRQGQ